MAHRRSPATVADPALLERVKGIVRRVLGHTPADVYLFGSWARGAQRPTSDIDVAIESAEPPLPRALLASLREALEESTIPNRVDVVDLAETDAAFRDRVRREGILWIASGSA
jgi:predicted nucleotidyltransferase